MSTGTFAESVSYPSYVPFATKLVSLARLRRSANRLDVLVQNLIG